MSNVVRIEMTSERAKRGRPGRAAVAMAAAVLLLGAAGAWWWLAGSGAGEARRALRALPASAAREDAAAAQVPRDRARAVKRGWRSGAGVDPRAWVFEPGVPARAIAGKVRWEDGRPAAGARVSATPKDLRGQGEWAVAEADAEGRFTLGALPAGVWFVGATVGDDSAVVLVESDDPGLVPPPDAVELVLVPCESPLVGTVVDPEDRPVAGARFESSGVSARALTAITGADGRFVICDQLVEVVAEGFAPARVGRLRGSSEELRVRLVPAGIVTGRVVDAAGQPVHGAVIESQRVLRGVDAVTDEAGAFRLDVRPGQVDVGARWQGRTAWSSLVVGPRASAHVELVLDDDCRRLAGHVRSAGQPLAGAQVDEVEEEVVREGVDPMAIVERWPGRTAPAVAQADGSFVMPCAPVEAFALGVRGASGLAPILVPAGLVGLDDVILEVPPEATAAWKAAREAYFAERAREAQKPVVVDDARPPREAVVIEGEVVDAAGAPVAGALVTMGRGLTRADDAMTDASGRFAIHAQRRDWVRHVFATSGDGRTGQAPIEGGRARVVLDATRELTVRWHGAEAAANAHLGIHCGGSWTWGRVVRGGEVVVPGVPQRADCQVKIVTDTHFGIERLGPRAASIDVRLDGYGEVVGLIVWPEGEPAPAGPVHCSGGGTTVRAGADGVFRLKRLIPSPTTVTCRAAGWHGVEEIELGSGEQRVDVYMTPGSGEELVAVDEE